MDKYEKRVREAIEDGIIFSDAGYVYFPKEITGFLSEHELRIIANVLEEKNKPWYDALAENLANKVSEYEWIKDLDYYDNAFWTLRAPYEDVDFYFRLKQRLEDDKIVWYSNSSEQLGGDMSGETWTCLEIAKEVLQNYYKNCLETP